MSQYLVDQINATDNVEVLLRHAVLEAHGEERLEALTIQNNETGVVKTVAAAALFIFIGAQFVGMGLLGEYLGRVYNDVRPRPRYFVQRVAGKTRSEDKTS